MFKRSCKIYLIILGGIALLSCSMPTPASAASPQTEMSSHGRLKFNNTAFTAQYENTNDLISGQTVTSDGNGKFRVDQFVNNKPLRVVMIFDTNQGLNYFIDSARKLVSIHVGSDSVASFYNDSSSLKLQTGESLGRKKVERFKCDGWKSTGANGTDEVWTDENSGIMISDTRIAANATDKPPVVKKLVKLKLTKPDPTLFILPAGYAQRDLSQPAPQE